MRHFRSLAVDLFGSPRRRPPMPKVRSRARPVSRSAPALLSESLTLRGSEGSADLIVNLPEPSEARARSNQSC